MEKVSPEVLKWKLLNTKSDEVLKKGNFQNFEK